jgi:hypothetical protein
VTKGKKMRSVLLTSLFSVIVAVGMPAQTVRLVGPGGFPSIDAAIAVSSPGDIVEVQAGIYAGFTANVGVKIVAGTSAQVQGNVVLSAPAGQTVELVECFLQSHVSVTSGRATLRNCQVQGGGQGGMVVSNASVYLQGTTVIGTDFFGLGALYATNSAVTAVGCGFVGMSNLLMTEPPLRLVGSRFHGSACTIGPGLPGVQFESLLDASAGSQVWLSDSSVASARSGDCTLLVSPDSFVRADRTSIPPGTGSGCATATPGLLLGVDLPQPLRTGQNFDITYRTAPNAFVFVFVGLSLGEVNHAPSLEQPSWLDNQTSFLASLAVADGSGVAAATFAIPGGSGIVNLSLWFEGISGLSFPLQASPPVGGMIR